MYNVKNRIYADFTKNQKAALCNYLRALVKKSPEMNAQEILDKFFDDEKYYIKIDNSRFPYLAEIIDESWFLNDTELYINECFKYYEHKKAMAPLLAKQKEFDKKKRKFLQEVKMSKEEATKKQLYYYEKLCKKYGLEKKILTSKLEARNEIDRIVNEHTRDIEDIDR